MFRFLVSHFCLQEIFQLHSYTLVFIVCPHLCPLPPRESVYEAIWLVSESHSAGGSNPSYQQLTLCTKEKKLFHCCFFPFHLMKTTKFSHFLGKLGIDDKLTQKQVKLFFPPKLLYPVLKLQSLCLLYWQQKSLGKVIESSGNAQWAQSLLSVF